MKCNVEERDDEEGGMMKCNAEPCQCRVGEAKKKREKKETRWTPESGESYPFRCPTPTRRQKWRVRATQLSMSANSSPTHPQLVFDVGSPIKPISSPGSHLISILCLLHCAKVSAVILFTQYLALCHMNTCLCISALSLPLFPMWLFLSLSRKPFLKGCCIVGLNLKQYVHIKVN